MRRPSNAHRAEPLFVDGGVGHRSWRRSSIGAPWTAAVAHTPGEITCRVSCLANARLTSLWTSRRCRATTRRCA